MKHNKFWANTKVFLGAFAIIFALGSVANAQFDSSSILEDYERFLNEHPEEQIFIQTDRDVYSPGTSIQFKAYITSGNSRVVKSDSLYVLLLNYLGEEILRDAFPIDQDRVVGEIQLDSEINYGEYTIKSYTNQSLQSAAPRLYSRRIMVKNFIIPSLRIQLTNKEPMYSPGDFGDIQIVILNAYGKPLRNSTFDYSFSQNGNVFRFGESSTDRKGRAVLNFNIPDEGGLSLTSVQVSSDYNGIFHSNSLIIPTCDRPVLLSFFPEGGRFIEGYETKIVFTAKNIFGEPIDVEGLLFDDNDRQIGTISTTSPGLGYFTLVPDIGNPVVVRLTEPFEADMEFPLPEIQDEGFQMLLDHRSDEELVFDLKYNYELDSLPIQVIAESGSQVVFTKSMVIQEEEIFRIPLANLPDGVLRVNVINEDYGLLAQRPIFIYNNRHTLNAETQVLDKAFEGKGKLNISQGPGGTESGLVNLSVSLVDQIMSPDWYSNPDICTVFLLGSSLEGSPFPPGYLTDTEKFDPELFDMFMISQINTDIFWKRNIFGNQDGDKSESEILQSLLDQENPGAMGQLLSVLRADQFNENYILNTGQDFKNFMASNQVDLEELELIPGKLSEEEIVTRLLERGTSVFNVVKVLQPIWTSGQVIYFRSPTSIIYQPPALIFIDGIMRGSSAQAIKDLDPFAVESVKVHVSIAEILKFGGLNSAGGIIEIVSKKSTAPSEKKNILPEEIYNPTLFWDPNVQLNQGSETSLTLPYPRLRTKHRLVIQGIDESGRPLYLKLSDL